MSLRNSGHPWLGCLGETRRGRVKRPNQRRFGPPPHENPRAGFSHLRPLGWAYYWLAGRTRGPWMRYSPHGHGPEERSIRCWLTLAASREPQSALPANSGRGRSTHRGCPRRCRAPGGVATRPGRRRHPLKGDMAGMGSSVSGNRRVVFRFEGNEVFDVDLVDHHQTQGKSQ